ncbi:MAG: metallophosphoesterase family protein [Verrucomicrobiota bacterium]
MKRREFFGKLTAGGVAGTVGVNLVTAQETPPAVPPAAPAAPAPDSKTKEAPPPAPGPLVTSPAALMAPRADGLDVVWAVSRLSAGRVEWELSDGTRGLAGSDAFGFVPQGENVLRVRLAGLPAGASGRLRTLTTPTIPGGGAVETGEWREFKTLNPAAAETKFVVWNDTHENAPTIKALHAATPPADFLLWNGDTCNNWITREMLEPTLLHPAGCDITAGRPLFITIGNHDVRGPWAWRTEEMIATPAGRPFWAFRSGPVAVICLHTGEDKPDDHPSFGGRVAFDALRREQADWLAKVIETPELRDAPHRLVFCHIPLRWKVETVPDYANGGYDSYSIRSRDAWHRSLVKWGAQTVISGHMHEHAWLPPAEGTFSYGQLVGGGPQPRSATWIEGHAHADGLALTMRNLAGKTLYNLKLPRLA